MEYGFVAQILGQAITTGRTVALAKKGRSHKKKKVAGPYFPVLTFVNLPKAEASDLQAEIKEYLTHAVRYGITESLRKRLNREFTPVFHDFAINSQWQTVPRGNIPKVIPNLLNLFLRLRIEPGRLKICGVLECSNFFWDNSQNRKRKYCEPLCGKQAKLDAHSARR